MLRRLKLGEKKYGGIFNDRRNFVINRSSSEFTQAELNLLGKGLKYRPKANEPPVDDIIVAIETSMRGMSFDAKSAVRKDTSEILSKKGPAASAS